MKNRIQWSMLALVAVVFVTGYACSSEVAIDYQLHRTSVNLARGYQQIEKAATALANDDADSYKKHLGKALDDFAAAVDHAEKAADDACTKAGNEIDKGNEQLQKAIDAYDDGNTDAAQKHYDKAVDHYDEALDLIDPE
jgi:tetratricopeptide (TPR) repeat protein